MGSKQGNTRNIIIEIASTNKWRVDISGWFMPFPKVGRVVV
ncbi:MAG: hypothetical protein ACW98F_16660 [Candidatus Hodarchaeales archaeon]|jgi:hypothetical protein